MREVVQALSARLIADGMSDPEAEAKGRLAAQAVQALGGRAEWVMYVPGRVEFLGKHTDYAGGSSIVCPVERGFVMAAAARDDRTVRWIAAQRSEEVAFALGTDVSPRAGHWSNYPMTVARRVARNFAPRAMRGMDAAFASDLPNAAGMSSSSALIVGAFGLMSEINGLSTEPRYRAAITTPETLAEYLGAIESGNGYGELVGDKGVGTFGGSEDHTAILCGRAGQLSHYSYQPTRLRARFDFPRDHVLAIAVSGVVAEKTAGARELYNRASLLVRRLVEIASRSEGRAFATLAEVVEAGPEPLQRLQDAIAQQHDEAMSTALRNRLEQFMVEDQQVIPAVSEALMRERVQEIGAWVDRSQDAAERLLANQVPETTWLCRAARRAGAAASSAFGAGFGGSVWAMVTAEEAPAFVQRWRGEYVTTFADRAGACDFFVTRPGPPAMLMGAPA